MPIKYLPDEIWFLIFEYLDEFSDAFNCALINKQCNAVVTPILWREIPVSVDKLLKILLTVELFREINNFPRAVAPGHLVRTVDCQIVDQDSVLLLFHRTPYITDISISHYLRNVSKKFVRKMLKDTLMYIPRLCPAITRLELINFFITTDLMETFVQHCPQLQEISIRDCSTNSPELLQPLMNCSLTKVKLAGRAWTTGKEIAAFLRQMTTLKSLTLENCKNDIDILKHLGLLVANENTGLPLLTYFKFDNTSIDGDIVQYLLEAFFKSHPLLQHLHLTATGIRDSLLTSIANSLLHLQDLHVSRYNFIGFSPDSVRYLAKKCPNLESIDIFGRSFRYEYGDHVVDHSLDITDLHRIRNNIPVGIILPEEKFHAISTDEGLKDIAELERMLNRMHVDIVLSEEEYEDTGDVENLSYW